ncbi:MAG: cellulose biosynthesis cyclic di-GMP-binding regulatory protein BcsB [Candidatus Baltobacteraceae bacterium]
MVRILAFVCFAIASACSVAQAARVQIPFSELGYANDISLTGPNPKFSLYVPVYPQLKSLKLRIPLTLSPLIDRRSTLTLTVNERPVFTTSVGALGKNPVISHVIAVPNGPRAPMDIALTGHFFRPGDSCYDLNVNDLWLSIGHAGTLTAVTNRVRHKPLIRDFLRDYNGRIAVVVSSKMATDKQYSVLRLAYYLHQVNRWRHTSVTLSRRIRRGFRNVVFGNFSKALEVRGDNLYANQDGVVALQHQLDELFITDSVQNTQYDQTASTPVLKKTFDDLGMVTQTEAGVGDLPFLIPLDLSQLGGLPSNLRLHVALTHTPLVPEDRAFLKVVMNNTLVRSFEFRRDGGEEDFDVPLADDVLRSTNDLRIVPSFFNKRGGCKGSTPQMTVSLLNSSSFSWDGTTRTAPSVGDFYNMAAGRVVALVGDVSLVPYAFKVLDSLGTINSSIKQLDVKQYDGSIPDGYDYAVIVAQPAKLSDLSLPLNPNGSTFSIASNAQAAGGGNAVYRAHYSQPFGVLEVAKSSTPALVATYWKSSSVTRGLGRVSPAELSSQTDNIFIYNEETATYSTTVPRAHSIPKGDALRKAMLPILGVFALALLALVIFTARRARNVS